MDKVDHAEEARRLLTPKWDGSVPPKRRPADTDDCLEAQAHALLALVERMDRLIEVIAERETGG